METHKITIKPPLFLIGKIILCWKCNSKMPAVALLAPSIENKEAENEVCILSDIQDLPTDLLTFINKKVPTFRYRFSKTANHSYFANTCPKCDTITGEFFTHSEPGGAFFPEDEDEAKTLYLTEIPMRNPITLNANFSTGPGEYILKNAKKI